MYAVKPQGGNIVQNMAYATLICYSQWSCYTAQYVEWIHHLAIIVSVPVQHHSLNVLPHLPHQLLLIC